VPWGVSGDYLSYRYHEEHLSTQEILATLASSAQPQGILEYLRLEGAISSPQKIAVLYTQNQIPRRFRLAAVIAPSLFPSFLRGSVPAFLLRACFRGLRPPLLTFLTESCSQVSNPRRN
jgi:hypothetical protein